MVVGSAILLIAVSPRAGYSLRLDPSISSGPLGSKMYDSTLKKKTFPSSR